VRTAGDRGRTAHIAAAALAVNESQKVRLADKIAAHFGGSVKGRTIAVWGLAFKPGTDDVREAASLAVIERLLTGGARVRAHDPRAIESARRVLGGSATFARTPYEALDGADALALLTEWPEYHAPDWDDVKARLVRPVVFDGRNIYDPAELRAAGFKYFGIGTGAAVGPDGA
jgi:UDPglucose 6-dehydrogenase